MNVVRFLSAALLSATVATSAGANSIFSYHSRGLGLEALTGEGRSMGMGYATLAVADADNPAGLNPAGLTGFPLTTLMATFVNSSRGVEGAGGGTAHFYEQNLRQFKAVVPFGYDVKAAMAFLPVSDLQTKWSGMAPQGSPVSYRDSLEASGGLWAGQFELARRFGDFSTGIRWRVVRGQLQTEWRRTVSSRSAPLASSALLTRDVEGNLFSLGGLYHFSDELTFGLTADIAADMDEKRTVSLGTRVPSSFYPQHEDGLSVVADENDTTNGTLSYPWGLGFGVCWKPGDRMTLAGDFVYQQWSAVHDDFEDTWEASLGLEITPSTSFRSLFFLQWPYRLGVRREMHYIPAGGSAPVGWFLSGGVGVPIGDGAGRIDYAVEYGTRGTISSNTAKETIWRHTISIVGWERWFEYRPRR